jgi:predicted TIM-barrel fold metal-dependent hydrolase
MKPKNPAKVNKRREEGIGRRQLLKSVVALTGGYAVAQPFLGSSGYAMGANPRSPLAGVAQAASDSKGTDILAKVSGGRRIDVHQHAILPEYVKALERSGIVESGLEGYHRKATVFTPTSIVQVASELGMEHVVLISFSRSGIHHGNDENARYLTQVTNDAMAKLVSGTSKQFGFYGILPLPDMSGALKQMEYALDTLHADGLAFESNQNCVYIGDNAYEELYAEMNRRSVVAMIHPVRAPYSWRLNPGADIPEFLFDTTRAAITLMYNGVIVRYPNIKWILAHAGGTLPYVSERMAVLRGEGNSGEEFAKRVPGGYTASMKEFYYDVAIAGSEAVIGSLTAIIDPSHIVYGSDWPYVKKEIIAEQVINFTQMPQFSGDRLEAMERKNSLRLFKRFS